MKIQKYLLVTALSLSILMVGLCGAAIAEDYNLQGRTVTYGYIVDLIERHFSEPEEAAYLRQVEEDFNVNVETIITPSISYAQELISYIEPQVRAGETYVDVLLTTNLGMYGAASEGLLMPLDDFLDDEYWDSLPPTVFRDYHIFPVDGSYYSFQASSFYAHRMLNNILLIYNKDLLAREGHPNPYELWKAGEWTWDAFKDIALAVTRDFDGSGENDQWALGERWNWNEMVFTRGLISPWVIANNGSGVNSVEGRMVFAMDEPETVEALEFLQELYHEEEVIMPLDEGTTNAFIDGSLAFLQSSTGYVPTLHSNEMEDDFSFVPIPKGPQADEHRATFTHILSHVMPITVEHPEEIIELTNAMFRITEDYWYTDSWEDESNIYDEDIIMSLRDIESMEVREWLYENTEVVLGFNDMWYDGFIEMMIEIMEGANISDTLGSHKPDAQAYLDDMYNYK